MNHLEHKKKPLRARTVKKIIKPTECLTTGHSVKQLLATILLISATSTYILGMQSIGLAKHNPEVAQIHERALRGFKTATTKNIKELKAAFQYFTHTDHPNRTLWLRQCIAVDTVLIPYLELKVIKKFNNLLSQELVEPDTARWQKILKVLPLDESVALHADTQLMKELIILCQKPSYAKWQSIIQSYQDRMNRKIDTQHPLKNLKVAASHDKKKEKRREYKKKKRAIKHAQKLQNVPAVAVLPEPMIPKTPTTYDLFWDALLHKDHLQAETIIIEHSGKRPLNASHPTLKLTPLHYAISKDSHTMCQLLLNHGADSRITSCIPLTEEQMLVDTTPLILAVALGRLARTKQLLSHKADPNQPSVCTQTGTKDYALDYAVSLFDDENQCTPQLQAEMIKLLLQHGATQFSGKVLYFDHGMKHGLALQLTSELDQGLIKVLLARKNVSKSIVCRDGNILLLGAPDVAFEKDDDLEELEQLALQVHLSSDSAESASE